MLGNDYLLLAELYILYTVEVDGQFQFNGARIVLGPPENMENISYFRYTQIKRIRESIFML